MTTPDSDFRIIVSENNPLNAEQWNKLATQNGNIWQSVFYDQVQLYFNNHPNYFQVFSGDELVGGLKIYSYKSKKLPAIIRFISTKAIQGSEILFDDSKNIDFNLLHFQLTRHIKAWLKKKNITSFYSYSFYGNPEKLISFNNQKKIWESKIGIAKIDLTNSIENLWSAIDPTHRGKVTKAKKNNVLIEMSDDIDLFFSLLDETYKNQESHVPNKKFIRHEYEILKSNNSAQIVFAKHEGKYLCGALLYNYGKNSLYNFAGTIKNNIGAGQFLHWEILNLLKENGYHNYLLGETSLAKNKSNLKFTEGITKFKLRFGAQQFPTQHVGYALNPIAFKWWKFAQKLFIKS